MSNRKYPNKKAIKKEIGFALIFKNSDSKSQSIQG